MAEEVWLKIEVFEIILEWDLIGEGIDILSKDLLIDEIISLSLSCIKTRSFL